mgnify:CR=1 FL=1
MEVHTEHTSFHPAAHVANQVSNLTLPFGRNQPVTMDRKMKTITTTISKRKQHRSTFISSLIHSPQ